jgi:hypothetical protein
VIILKSEDSEDCDEGLEGIKRKCKELNYSSSQVPFLQ